MRNVKYDYSSCHIELPKSLAKEIVKWGREKVGELEVGAADPDARDAHQDLVGPRLVEVHLGEGERPPGLLQQRCSGPHTRPFDCDTK